MTAKSPHDQATKILESTHCPKHGMEWEACCMQEFILELHRKITDALSAPSPSPAGLNQLAREAAGKINGYFVGQGAAIMDRAAQDGVAIVITEVFGRSDFGLGELNQRVLELIRENASLVDNARISSAGLEQLGRECAEKITASMWKICRDEDEFNALQSQVAAIITEVLRGHKLHLDPLGFWRDLAEALGHDRPAKADIPALVSEVKELRLKLGGSDLYRSGVEAGAETCDNLADFIEGHTETDKWAIAAYRNAAARIRTLTPNTSSLDEANNFTEET